MGPTRPPAPPERIRQLPLSYAAKAPEGPAGQWVPDKEFRPGRKLLTVLTASGQRTTSTTE